MIFSLLLGEWDVRLTNDTIFEVYLLDQWGTPCDDFWSLANTDVVCRSIGYRRGKSFSSGIKGHTSEFHLDDVICLGNESHIRNCKYRLLGDDCSANEHIRITCEKGMLFLHIFGLFKGISML